MAIKICPRCQARILVDPFCEDVEHECISGSPTRDNEDVIVVGDWEDYSGSGKRQNVNLQGAENTFFGTRAAIEGANDEESTRRGVRASTRRTRKHIEHIKFQEGGN